MFSKIFLSLLLLTCVYTYIIKSTKDNNDTNFQKLPDNFNIQLDENKTVKPNLKMVDMEVVQSSVRLIFGKEFASKIKTYLLNYEKFIEIFDENVMSKIKESKKVTEQKKIFEEDMSPNLKNAFQENEMNRGGGCSLIF